MGLEITVHGTQHSKALGSYSSVHYLRWLFIIFALRWLENNHMKSSNFQETIFLLKGWIKPGEPKPNMVWIKYNSIPPLCPDTLIQFGLSGVYWFVNHSDCDGAWSFGQCADIVMFFYQIFDGSIHVGDKYYKEKDIKEMLRIFEDAVERHSYVECT